MITRVLYILFPFLFSAIIAMAQFDVELFDRLNQDDGLSSSVVTCIMKDSRGFMWFGTQDGLNKYDGYKFTTYRLVDSIPNSISGNYILSLFEDNGGNIWIGTENNGLNRYDRSKDIFTKYQSASKNPENLSNYSVRDVAQTSNGTLYFATDQGVLTFDPKNERLSTVMLSGADTVIQKLAVYDLFIDADKSIWIGTSNGLFHYHSDRQKIEGYFHDPLVENSISNNFINTIHRSNAGYLYIGTNRGLNAFDPDLKSFRRYYYNPEGSINEAKSEVQAIAEDNRGNLWVGSFGGGLVKINEQSEQTASFVNNPDERNSISNDYVYSLYYDDAGILWVGTYGGGLNKIDQVKIRFDHLESSTENPNSLPSNEVYSILPMTGEVWFGTEKGISRWDEIENKFHTVLLSEKNGQRVERAIYSLLEDSHKNIWVGSADFGIEKISVLEHPQQTQNSLLYTKNSSPERRIVSDQILCMHEDILQNIWIGTLDGISVIKNDTVVAEFKNDPTDSTSLVDNEIYSIFSDRSGTIWIGTFLGLNKYNPQDSSFHFFENILSDKAQINSIYCIFQDMDGFLWIGTDNSGLIKFDIETEKAVRQYTRADKLPDNVIYGILEDKEKNLWLSSNNGLIKAIRQEGSDNLTFIHYNSDNWLNADAYNIGAFAKGEDGTMYFGSFEGVTYFRPENVKGNTYKPPVYITDFQLFFNPVSISDDHSTPLSAHISETHTLDLSYQQNVLKFSFSALNYFHPEKNSYAFMMENLEDQWNYVDNLREAQYMYIPPGDYVFRVKAANNDGVWNEEGTSIAITITPPFTQTIWFYLIIIAGIILIVFWMMHIRTRRLRATRNRLEKQVQVRTKELRETNQNLEVEIQERQKVQEALAKSEARFRQLIDTMNEGFSVQDRKGRINYVNPKLCTMFGREQDEILGKFPIDFVDDSSPEHREKFIEEREIGIKKGFVNSYEMHWKRKDGSSFIAMVSPKPIFDKENTYTGSVAVLTDITDLKNAEKLLLTKNKDLNEALDDLRKTQAQLIDSEKMASLGQLTAGVAHEINNPINFVSGNVLPLRRDIEDILDVLKKYDLIIHKLNMGADFSEVEKFKEEIDFEFVLSEINNLLDGIGEGASRTAEIVKGLRNFTRMDEHELKMASINQGIDSTLLILHNKIKNRVEIEKEYGEFPDIMCYPGQLNQVFMNLLNNAQEAIQQEGKILIRTWKKKNMVNISVSDNGKGIPMKVQKKIFDPFFTTKEVGKGTGLGLSISFGIVEKHNGTIRVTSEPGKGTEFIVSIPDNLT